MADVTYADAFAALRAECGEPTYERAAGGSHDAMWGSVVAASVELNDIFGEVWIEVDGSPDDRYELEYRKVRTSSGFEGTVCWHAFDGRSGFEQLA